MREIRTNGGITTRGILSSAAAVMGGIIVAVLATSGTYAYLSDDTQHGSTTITAGSAGLAVEPLTGLDVSGLLPGDSVFTAFNVANEGHVDLSVTAGINVDSNEPDDDVDLASYLMVTLAVVDQKTDCDVSATGDQALMPAFTSTSRVIAAKSTQVHCLIVTVEEDAPSEVNGEAVSFTLTFDGIQVGS